jgi:DNA primase large subunit
MSLAMGLSQEQTCGFFVNAPDYSADTTGYQINQIFERKYTPHGCAALKTSARCPVSPGDDRLCDQEWLTHPLKYLKAKQRRRFQENGRVVTIEENNENSPKEDNSS